MDTAIATDSRSFSLKHKAPFQNVHTISVVIVITTTILGIWDALKIINLSLKLAGNTLSDQMKEELRTLGARNKF
ncbi:hypothetical protein BUALT_Bualt08G0004600 [Buddleja alternifolia]|uniref:Uncharacterized protein n=1 Tax=Buddleja alternifolia TaxID=168488 RepID=A0AAV6X316_9LAMI|nr:hypothetical protein BUALT_Bualt08G0004600 [Buddleja alternifolia]